MSAASAGIRTYGKRPAIKRKQTIEIPELDQSQASPTKRRKISPEATDTEESLPVKPKVKTTYGSPRKQPSTPQVVQPDSSPKAARDLSRIFDSITPASPSPSPSKLAKRMLSRSKTESSIESRTPTPANTMDRTPSLPIFPSLSQSDIFKSPKPVAPLLPLLAPGVKSTRTYATKFRRILEIPVPANGDPLAQTVDDDVGFDAPESYASLRTRWGVDNSEDDPYPRLSHSPTKSNSATPDVSPSRAGKGKSRTNVPAVRPPPIPAGMMNSRKSISELRNKGESRRFLDEVGYLFEGMDQKGGIGLRRASALEVTTKLCDPDFTRKAKAADFFSRTWNVFLDSGAGKGEDKILDVLLTFFVSLVARDPASLLELAERPVLNSPSSPVHKAKETDKNDDSSLVGILFRLLQEIPPNLDPLVLISPQSKATDADLKKAGINKKDKLTLTTIYKTIQSKSRLFFPSTPISMSLMVTYSLQALPSHLIPSAHFPTFLSSLRLALTPHPSTSLSSTLSSHWMDAVSRLPFEAVYYHLRLMDTYLLDQWDQTPTQAAESANEDELNIARDSWLAEDFIALGVCIELVKGNEDTLDAFPIQKCLDTILRVLVSLTHSDEHWGRKVVRSEYGMGFLMRTLARTGREFQMSRFAVKEEEGVDDFKCEDSADKEEEEEENGVRLESYALDTLCLALGLLTNLVQIVEEAKDVVRKTRLKPSCPLKKRTCARKCSCPQSKSGIDILAELYAQQQHVKDEPSPSSSPQHQKPLAVEDTPETRAEADASFLRGHLAVLFGLLMVGNPENQSMVLAALPSASPSPAPPNIHVIGKGKEKHAKRAKLARLVEQAKDFAVFYTVISNHTGGEKESKVAREVVRFLETQRDSVV
ncbi:hypothetical protein M413DRAFT_24942 [Hebeloma cylindrosporum]|uniref:Wings apart-like protein C-terminal domain-containing protein n=1 Tax=Hebeloma cylindrosporum TaxID=76867 RepID=A0A0C3CKX7_HEBCY|nr:hypothetical protein M413DRAFT_24942 [Hebeloma cylindrosporum h7]